MSDSDLDTRAAEFVLGTMDAEARVTFSEEMESDPALQALVSKWEQHFATLAEDVPEDQPSEALWGRIEAALDAGAPAVDFVTVRASEGEWQTLYEGVEKKSLYLDAESETETYLIRMAPGTRLINHPHSRIEECIVLEGDVVLGGEAMGPGDFQAVMPGVKHEGIETTNGAVFLVRGELRKEFERLQRRQQT